MRLRQRKECVCQSGATPGALRSRLGALRDKACWLKLHAELGRDLRLALSAAGAPTWNAAEDLSFRTWIEEHGDEQARQMLIALDDALDAELAELQAREAEECEAGGVDATPEVLSSLAERAP